MEFYRYEAINYASIGIDGEYEQPNNPNPEIQLIVFILLRETEKGYWICIGGDHGSLRSKGRWVSKTAKKRYAYPTKSEAMTNFLARTNRMIRILSWQLDTCRVAVSKAEIIKTRL